MRRVYIFLIGCVSILTSCKNEVERTIEGSWSIDTIYYKNFDVKICMNVNVVDFKKERWTSLPYSKDRCIEVIKNSHNENGNWEIIQSEIPKDTIPLRLKITTDNEVFAGIHKVVFYKDEPNKLLKMEIWSDNLYLVCRKGLFNFDKNIELINELEKISWLNRPEGQN